MSQQYHAKDTNTIQMTINASDHNDSWRKIQLTAIIPVNDPYNPIHLQAQTVIKGILQQVIERDIDITPLL